MAVYQRLLLSAGGGVVSTQQQAEQARDTATVLIGLGGTGIDCLRTIKTQVHARLKADDPEAVEPAYRHIRLLGVDCDNTCLGSGARDGLLPLDPTEYFSIANPNVIQALGNKQALAIRDELRWLRHEDIHKPDLADDIYRGGVRQVGRFMMMDRSSAFMARVQQEINAAKEGLQRPQVYVHIFTGLSGGTGAGCFLDVCYMVRHVAAKLGGGITTLGYFFLPDVNLAKIPMSRDTVRQYVPINGYTALQELDYCMSLPHNGGAFTQEYQGHNEVKWDRPPVDVAFLIGATDANANVIQNAYEYAMNVTAEYVMDFLTYDTSGFGLSLRFNPCHYATMRLSDSAKRVGANLSYCALGASCASLPLRQVNTYLASELFSRFAAIGGNVPSRSDVDALSRSALCQAGFESAYAYDSLWMEIQDGAGDSYALYDEDYVFALMFGDHDLIEHYTKQTARKNGVVERNAKNLMGGSNQGSLLSRMSSALAAVIRDADRGPVFAHGLLDASRDYSLLNVVDGLIAQNEANWRQEGAQTQRLKDCEDAQSDFRLRRRRSLFDSDKRRFAEFEHYLRLLEEHKYLLVVYEKLDGVLRALRRQVEDAASGYYLRLARVTCNLIETFAENRDVLEDPLWSGDFAESLLSTDELRDSLDGEIGHVDTQDLFDKFMQALLADSESWLQEDEGKICRLVTDFFVRTAFGDFAGRSITAFLRDKYDTTTDAQLANRIYQDWMVRLTAKAAPLFCFDNLYQGSVPPAESLACLSVPRASAPIKAAAQRMQSVDSKWQVKDGALTDRICALLVMEGIPAFAHFNLRKWEHEAFSGNDAGRHYYETPGLEGMPFSDWRGLAPLTPQSLIKESLAPQRLADIVRSGRELYNSCVARGVIDREGAICALDESVVQNVQHLLEVGERALEGYELQSVANLLSRLDSLTLTLEPTELRLLRSHEGNPQSIEELRQMYMDRFVSAPALQSVARSELEQIERLEHDLNELMERLQNYMHLLVLDEAVEGYLIGERDIETVTEEYGIEGDDIPILAQSPAEEHDTQLECEGESIDV